MKRNHEKCLDSQLWNACAGGMVQMPPVNSKVFYFPQGHAEHATGNVDFGNSQVPSLILCRMSSIKYMADGETDEVFAKIRLIPVKNHELELDDEMPLVGEMENVEKAASFAKTLTQSDANNGGGFSVPRYCAETIFPRLDYSAEPPVQTIIAKDVHGESWKFRHIYRGTPRRHLLTTGWSNFVNKKKLVAGDSVVFLRADNGDLCVGIRRAKRGIGGGPEYGSGWNTGGSGTCVPPFGGYYGNGLLQKGLNGDVQGKVTGESVVRAATLAATGQPFEVVYYPRASTPEFFVKAASVSAAMRIQWCSGMRFKMPFETEDSSRISWFMGTISSVQVADPIRWPNSPWRLLQVAWDEPDLLQNVKRVSPWLVELVSSMPSIHLSPFSPPRKKLRVPVPPNADFSLMDQIALPSSFPGNHPLMVAQNSPLCFIPDNIPAGIQGARHAHHQYGLSPPDLCLNKLHSGLFPVGSQQLDYNPRFLSSKFLNNNESDPKGNNISCRLTMGTPVPAHCLKENGEKKSSPPHILLFGQLILAENQSSESLLSDGNNTDKTSNSSGGSGSALHQNGPRESSSEEGLFPMFKVHQKGDLESETGHCKVFMESEDVGRTLDLSVFGSYEELYRNIAEMFGMEGSEVLSKILYRDAAGAIKHAGDEPFCDFLKTAKRLTIPTGSSMMK